MWKWLRYRLLPYGLILLVIWLAFPLLENKIVFHPEFANPYPVPWDAIEAAGSELSEKVQNVYFESLDGTRLNGWYVAPAKGMPTAIYAHGNGGNMGSRTRMVYHFMTRGYGFLMFDYRGYGSSEGSPSEVGVYQDFEAASHYVEQVHKIPASQQIAVGESLGSAAVVDVASRKSFRQVVLLSAFTSGEDFAIHNIFPVSLDFLTRQKFDSVSKINRITVPLVIVHGEDDAMMPMEMAETLYAKAGSKQKTLIKVKNAGHNDAFLMGADQVFAVIEKNELALGR